MKSGVSGHSCKNHHHHTTLTLLVCLYPYQIQEKKLCYFVFILLLICVTCDTRKISHSQKILLLFSGYLDHPAIKQPPTLLLLLLIVKNELSKFKNKHIIKNQKTSK